MIQPDRRAASGKTLQQVENHYRRGWLDGLEAIDEIDNDLEASDDCERSYRDAFDAAQVDRDAAADDESVDDTTTAYHRGKCHAIAHAIEIATELGDEPSWCAEAISWFRIKSEAWRHHPRIDAPPPCCRAAIGRARLIIGSEPTVGRDGRDELDSLLDSLATPAKPLVRLVSFPEFELGPGQVDVLGAPPAAGKTLMAMQMVFEAIEYDTSQVAYVLNCEMSPQSLLRRELSRLTGIDARSLRFGNLTDDDRESIRIHSRVLRERLERVRFVRADAEGLAMVAKAKPGIVLIDYVQRFTIGRDRDPRQSMNGVMTFCRHLADRGHSVLAISATKRSQEGKHSNAELSLSSFRESGEIEYGCDAAYVLKTSPPNNTPYRPARLECVKNRHGEPVSLDLIFSVDTLSFSPAAEVNEFNDITSGQLADDDDDCFGSGQ